MKNKGVIYRVCWYFPEKVSHVETFCKTPHVVWMISQNDVVPWVRCVGYLHLVEKKSCWRRPCYNVSDASLLSFGAIHQVQARSNQFRFPPSASPCFLQANFSSLLTTCFSPSWLPNRLSRPLSPSWTCPLPICPYCCVLVSLMTLQPPFATNARTTSLPTRGPKKDLCNWMLVTAC